MYVVAHTKSVLNQTQTWLALFQMKTIKVFEEIPHGWLLTTYVCILSITVCKFVCRQMSYRENTRLDLGVNYHMYECRIACQFPNSCAWLLFFFFLLSNVHVCVPHRSAGPSTAAYGLSSACRSQLDSCASGRQPPWCWTWSVPLSQSWMGSGAGHDLENSGTHSQANILFKAGITVWLSKRRNPNPKWWTYGKTAVNMQKKKKKQINVYTYFVSVLCVAVVANSLSFLVLTN